MPTPPQSEHRAASAETPRSLGFRMPAEWEPHAATWIGWPQNRSDWPGKFASIAWAYADMVRYLARHEQVCILVNDGVTQQRARRVLDRCDADLDNVRFFQWPTNRVWTRDSGPIFVKDAAGALAVTNWRFNAWAKYPDWQLDDALPTLVADELRLREWQPEVEIAGQPWRVVLEGGSIDGNGAGAMLTTEECLLSKVQARNPGLSRARLEEVFAEFLGVTHVIWLGNGIAGDDTHGHVDDIARFVAPGVVVAAVEPNAADYNHAPLAENLRRLKAARDQRGKQLTVVELPLPAPVYFNRQRLPASYLNFYIANRMVLVPTFNDPMDRIALNTLAEVFPGREVVGIHCADFVWGLGTLHCATQQQPLAGQG